MKEAEYLQTTKTFSPTLEKREFTEDEKTVLNHFFTNIDQNIYAATDAMPSALWALLMGGYSRSHLSVRMRFLNIFEEMQEDCVKGKVSQEEIVTIKQMADQIRSGGGLDLTLFLSKAEKFMRKWAVQYGHDSLKDSDVARFAVENVSQFIIPVIEEARLGAYQEKSTRYVSFSGDCVIIPTDLQEFETEIKEWNKLLITTYDWAEPIVKEFLRQRMDPEEFKTEAALNRTLNAKTYDVIRYLLPNTMVGSLGIVWPTREAERHISKLLSSPVTELHSVGKALLEEGKKISPGLLSHVSINDYQVCRKKNAQELHQEFNLNLPSPQNRRSADAVKVLSATPNLDAHLAASILFRNKPQTNSFDEYFQLCLNNPNLVAKTFEVYLGERGKFDPFPLSTEIGNIVFEVTMDFGAYRDLKRHRKNLLLHTSFTALNGFEYPEYVIESPELIEVKNKVELCAQKTTELHQKIKEKYPCLAGYIVMFAHKQQLLWQMDPRQLAYIVELRTTPAGHHSYRTICQQMFEAAEPHLPNFSKYIRVDMSSGAEGRKKQEEKVVEKLKSLGGDVEKVI